ncbi:MAG: hypothetical protein NXI15_05015 [Gammaproteobacteria bacterium]|nr:hypothetical protein [Gammaproteobacteria bacterium]
MLAKMTVGLAALVSLLLLAIGAHWQIDPTAAAAELGMPLLEDGIGRSSQIGDLTAFFVVGGVFGLLGVVRKNPLFLYTPAALVGAAAVFRTLAWLLHGADFAPMIIPEILMLIVYIAAIRTLRVTAA